MRPPQANKTNIRQGIPGSGMLFLIGLRCQNWYKKTLVLRLHPHVYVFAFACEIRYHSSGWSRSNLFTFSETAISD